ncbi:oxidoreductase [Jiulongibacter sediminis]|uniref:Oxidoreductase n=2 Tax=Jiulongibacter sediminis TaxID=1605367 RepID=A0A0P7C295_9BACT|nr:oxidoreductase [Jiulongibacter sediminis]TBX23244.1 oxidoreductase [Jiulongibacter sediminis]
MQKMTALIVGASGLVGRQLLHLLLVDDFYQSVTSVGRKQLDINHPKLKQEIVDFNNPDLSKIYADHIFCTLGTTIKKAGSQENFKKVDYQYPFETAKAGLNNGSELFAIVTAMGSDPKSMFFYNRVKGEVELSLKELNYDHLGIFRPSMLLGDRQESRLGEQIGQWVMKAIGFLIPANFKAIEAKKVANAMLKYAKSPKKGLSEISSGQML